MGWTGLDWFPETLMITRAHAAIKKYTSWSQFFAQERSYRTLRAHYASAHWRPWFDQPPAQGERPRRQRWPTGCFLTGPPLKMSLVKKKTSLCLYMYEEGCIVQFQLVYFDFRLLNFHLMTSLQCWRIFWQFQLVQVDTAWSRVRPVQGEVIRGRQEDGGTLRHRPQ